MAQRKTTREQEQLKLLESAVDVLRKRLSHLLESDFIASFDERRKDGEYERNIVEADAIAKKAELYDEIARANAEPEMPCRFRGECIGACEWCKEHDYSEACVPMLQAEIERYKEMLVAVAREALNLATGKEKRNEKA